MKKVFLVLMILALGIGNVYAGVQIELNKISGIHCDANINYYDKAEKKYYPVKFRFQGMAESVEVEGILYPVESILLFGPASDTKYPLKTFEDQKAYYQALPAFLRGTFKDMFTTGTGDDVSQ